MVAEKKSDNAGDYGKYSDDDFGKGFRQWSTNIESNSESNSFLSRGTIIEFLNAQKSQKEKEKDKEKGKDGKRHSRKTMDKSGSTTKSAGSTTTKGKRKTLGRSKTLPEGATFEHLKEDQPAAEQPQRRNRKMHTQRKPPTYLGKKDYTLAVEPHSAADGIMLQPKAPRRSMRRSVTSGVGNLRGTLLKKSGTR